METKASCHSGYRDFNFRMTYHYIKKTILIRSITIDINDLKRIIKRLLKHVDSQGNIETSKLRPPPEQDEEEFWALVDLERQQAFRISVTIAGYSGEQLFGDGAEVLDSPNIPDKVAYVFLSNEAAYQGVTGRPPANKFYINFDFSKPPLIDNNNPVSNPTPNNSSLTIEGDQDTWISAIEEACMGVLENRDNKRSFLHKSFVYDVGLFIFGIPLALYVCWKFSGFVDETLGSKSGFLSAVAYFYIFFFVINMYRILFGYTKWAFPTVELEERRNDSKMHRKFWFGVVASLLGALIYDLFF